MTTAAGDGVGVSDSATAGTASAAPLPFFHSVTNGAVVKRGVGFASIVRILTGTGSTAPNAMASRNGSPGIAPTMLRSDASQADTTD